MSECRNRPHYPGGSDAPEVREDHSSYLAGRRDVLKAMSWHVDFGEANALVMSGE